ncbi:hypothetical protein IAG41_00025 [Sphingomonas sp. JC676]|uniref:hypothetical protein n=1 Tax=Sphingomonas sp. JC676 TaxID=2768065 RepID=UPI001657E983|nr:hypothetical protein [Sphingomonas sp. JC676]MBC9030767.1 hypothetical protein [Sphingomonas sp. JC676]
MYRTAFKVLPWPLIGALLACAVQFYSSFQKNAHDKGFNADVLQPLRGQENLPIGTIVPQNNRWKSNAFVAERSGADNAVLILDDHYRGSDPAYRSDSGVIGDEISRTLLCSLPTHAKMKAVIIDPVVAHMISSKCPNVR